MLCSKQHESCEINMHVYTLRKDVYANTACL